MSEQGDTQPKGEERGAKGIHVVISTSITLVAAAVGALHAVFPRVTIDAVTMGFFGIAILPWLLPYLKSAKLPGGVELEFQDLKREVKEQLATGVQRVEAVASQVQEVIERFAISGTSNKQVIELLDSTLGGFHAYLIDIGFVLAVKPSVRIEKTLGGVSSYYDGNQQQIVTAEAYSGYPDLACRDYGHYALVSAQERAAKWPSGDWPVEEEAIESGLADYYACSYKDDPIMFRKSVTVLAQAAPLPQRDLSAPHRFDEETKALLADADPAGIIQVGEVWGALFWALRSELGRRKTDRLLLEVWSTPHQEGPFADALRSAARAKADAERVATIDEIFASRGA